MMMMMIAIKAMVCGVEMMEGLFKNNAIHLEVHNHFRIRIVQKTVI